MKLFLKKMFWLKKKNCKGYAEFPHDYETFKLNEASVRHSETVPSQDLSRCLDPSSTTNLRQDFSPCHVFFICKKLKITSTL